MKTIHRSIAITFALLVCAGARGELKWEQTAVELHPSINDTQAVGHFKYKNTGNSSCGCTTAQTQKDEVPPGTDGEITATFNIGDRTGTQVKTITVETDDPDPEKAKTVLTIKAIIPQSLEINPGFVFWQSGEEAKPKTITVKAAKEFPVKNITVKASTQDFETKVTKAADDEYKVEVQPKDTSHMAMAALTIQSEGSPKLFYANARVMPPMNSSGDISTAPLAVKPAIQPSTDSAVHAASKPAVAASPKPESK
jgi:hypothetical protein